MMRATKPFNLIYEGEWNDIVCVDYRLTPERYTSRYQKLRFFKSLETGCESDPSIR